jgi:antitoxin (DNA-binding transcriptional repressor) of toxin-antitoxin stability system
MATINILEAKEEFDRLVDLAEQGQDTIIVRDGKPVARLTHLAVDRKPIRYGALKGKITIAEDFDAPLPHDFLITPEA